MMDYTLEEIYALVGKEDKTAMLTFKHDSESYKNYGDNLTVVFNYTQKERVEFDELIKSEKFLKSGFVKATYLIGNLSKQQIETVKSSGINSDDIESILYFNDSTHNTFHSSQTRKIKTMTIPMTSQPKGGDFDWMYGFYRRLVKDDIILTPQERHFYLAGKLYFEPTELTKSEIEEIYIEELILHEDIEYQFLFIKLIREEISDDEKKRLGLLRNKKSQKSLIILEKHLQDAGSSFQKLAISNFDKAVELFSKVENFKEKKFSFDKRKIIYLDVNGYLHIFMRHVEEMKINKHFEHKDNFQWKEENIFTVMQHVIEQVIEEIQVFFVKNPNGRFSLYGDRSIYFEGDYYTLHIENDGRISTFYKNKKIS